MTLSEQTEQRVYDKLRAFDGVEVAGHEPVDSSIASVLSEGEVLADDGSQYSSIQDAIDASDNWVFAGPGTYYENVVIDKDDFTLQGAGYDTLIDGGDVDYTVKVASSNVTVSSLRLETGANHSTYFGILLEGGNNRKLDGVYVTSGYGGIQINESSQKIANDIITNCRISDTSYHGIISSKVGGVIYNNNTIDNTSGGFVLGSDGEDDSIIANNVVQNTSSWGMLTKGNDGVVIGNRVINSGSDGIQIDSQATDVIVANNRVSGSTGSDINNLGTGTVTDGNLTGSAN